jgi:hypothetical protein
VQKQTQAPQQNALARLLRVTQPPSLISVLADGQAATAVHHHAITPLAATKGLPSDTFMMVALGGWNGRSYFADHPMSHRPL